MDPLAIPHSRITIIARFADKNAASRNFYECGEGVVIAMSQEQQQYVRSLIGDGQAGVTMSAEMSESDYGTGLKVFCSIKLACNQSEAVINAAVNWAADAAKFYAEQHFNQLKNKLIADGFLKAPKSGPMFGPT